GKVYGGGAATIARQTGAPEDDIRRAMAAYDRVCPEIRRMSNRWQREAHETVMVHVSATGRRLPLDRTPTYAVVDCACARHAACHGCVRQGLSGDPAHVEPLAARSVRDWHGPRVRDRSPAASGPEAHVRSRQLRVPERCA